MTIFLVLLIVALLFDFLNGFHDSANLVATVIASRALPPRVALLLAALAEFAGPFLFGTAVAAAIGDGLLAPGVITIPALLCALGAAIGWNLVTWRLGLPASSSHALIGGLVGAAVASAGWHAVIAWGLIKILAALFLSPLLGIAAGFLVMRLLLFLCRHATPDVNRVFRIGQIFTSLILALSHSANDAQKTMGVITLGLVIAGMQSSFHVPGWVILLSASAIALGSYSGAWRLIRTLGGRVITVRPIHGFAAQLSGAGVILGAALLGGPVSSTQVLGSALMGVGSAERITKVRWEAGREMLWAWMLTIPVCIVLGAGLYWVVGKN
jgi:inorganic phosphate transporter, PiT family